MSENTDMEIDLLRLLNVLIRYAWVIIIAIVLGAIVGFGYHKFMVKPQYEASVNMIVNTRSEGTTNVTSDNITSARNMVGTYGIIITSNTVLNQVIEKLQLDMKYSDLSKMITVGSVNGTQVMQVAVRDTDPERAKRILEEITAIAPSAIVNAVGAGSCKVISDVETGNEPVSSGVKKYLVGFAMIGCMISAGFIILKELFNNYIEDDKDVERYLGLPVLGVIPEVEDLE